MPSTSSFQTMKASHPPIKQTSTYNTYLQQPKMFMSSRPLPPDRSFQLVNSATADTRRRSPAHPLSSLAMAAPLSLATVTSFRKYGKYSIQPPTPPPPLTLSMQQWVNQMRQPASTSIMLPYFRLPSAPYRRPSMPATSTPSPALTPDPFVAIHPCPTPPSKDT